MVKDEEVYEVSRATLEGYQGWYRNSRTGGGLRLSMNGENLAAQNNTLTPGKDRVFLMGTNRIVFYPEHRRNGLVFINADNDSTFFSPVDPANTSLQEYAGEYYSDEAEARYTVLLRDNKLYIQQKPKAAIPLQPTYKDGFEYPGCILFFERDRNNRIINFKISISRARNVEFKKVR